MPGTLGCGETRAYLQERGGASIVDELTGWSQVQHGRRLDEISEGRLRVAAEGLANESCCFALARASAWEHEIRVDRDDQTVWVGPLVEPQYDFTGEGADFIARDLWQWFERRLLPVDRDITGDLSEIFRQFAVDALSSDESPNIILSPGPTGVTGHRIVVGSLLRRAADEMRELARSGLDFTMIGREMRTGGTEIPTPLIGTLSLDWFTPTSLRYAGLDQISSQTVVGARGSEPGDMIRATAGGVSGRYGLLENVAIESAIQDSQSAQAAADTRLLMFNEPPIFLSGLLDQSAPIAYEDLVPGARVAVGLEVACRPIFTTLRLAGVRVTVDAREQGVEERVEIDLIPLGTTDPAL